LDNRYELILENNSFINNSAKVGGGCYIIPNYNLYE